jgi:hypothetical protein
MNGGRALLRQLVVKIMPLRIVALNQLQFSRAAPFLDALFAEGSWSRETMHSVIANKSTDSIRTMLPSTARNITCDTDIKGAITLAGKEVDSRTLLSHSAAPCSCQGQALGPRVRGDDENLSSLPSEDTEARRVRHTPIYATRY